MNFAEIILIGIGLSMDAFAVALCKGLSMKTLNVKAAFIIAGFFGFFQALMPLIGWLLGSTFEKYISSFDHWVAFGLLFIIGGKMLFDAIKELKEEIEAEEFRLKIPELFLLAVATSIDALAIGITLACLGTSALGSTAENLSIWLCIVTIGAITFILSFIGVFIGNKFGARFKAKAEIAGGIVLILIGVKILLEHLNVISF